MLVASAMTAIHRDRLVLIYNAQWPDIQPLVSRAQIVPAHLPKRAARLTTIILVHDDIILSCICM